MAVDFIRSNPYTEQRRANQIAAERRFAQEERERQAREQRGLDAALRGAVMGSPQAGARDVQGLPWRTGAGQQQAAAAPQQPAGAPQPQMQPRLQPRSGGLRGNMISALSRTPGGGQMAAKMALDAEEREFQLGQKVFEMATQNPDLAEQFAMQNGVDLPPQIRGILRNRQAAALVAQEAKVAASLYPGITNAAIRSRYLEGRLRGIADQLEQQQMPSLSVPTSLPTPNTTPAGAYTPRAGRIVKDGQGRQWLVDVYSGNVQPLMAGGQQMTGTVSGPRPTNPLIDEKRIMDMAKARAKADPTSYDAESGASMLTGEPVMNPEAYARNLARYEAEIRSQYGTAMSPMPEGIPALPGLGGDVRMVQPGDMGAGQGGYMGALSPEGYPIPQTQEEFDALPEGTLYIDPDDGLQYVKE